MLPLLAVLLVILSSSMQFDAIPPTHSTEDLNERCRELVEKLGSEDFSARRDAASQLTEMGRDARPALPLILELLEKTDNGTPLGEKIHESAARVLIALARADDDVYDAVIRFIDQCPKNSCLWILANGSNGALPPKSELVDVLMKKLVDPDERIQFLAATTFYRYVQLAKDTKNPQMLEAVAPAVPDLVQALGKEKTRPFCVRTLLGLSFQNVNVVPEIAKAARESDSAETRKACIEILGAMNARVVPTLLDALEDPDETVQMAAREAIGTARMYRGVVSADDVPAIRKALCSDDGFVRTTAAGLLGNGHPGEVWAVALAESLLDHSSADVRATALKILARIGSPPEADSGAILKAAVDPEIEVRRAAFSNLERFRILDENLLLAHLALLKDPDDDLRHAARDRWTWGMGSREFVGTHGAAIPPLIALLTDEDQANQKIAIQILGDLGTASRPALGEIEKKLADPKSDIQWMAATALGKLARQLPEVVTRLLEILASGDEPTLWIMPDALAKCDHAIETILPELVRIMKTSPNQHVRSAAMMTLGKFGPRAAAATPALIEVVSSSEAKLQSRAIDALGEIGPEAKEAGTVLLDILADSQLPELRRAAAEAMRKIGVHQQEVVDYFLDELNGSNPYIDVLAIRSLGEIGAPAKVAVPRLVELTKSANYRHQAVRALGQIGPAANEAIPRLIALLRD